MIVFKLLFALTTALLPSYAFARSASAGQSSKATDRMNSVAETHSISTTTVNHVAIDIDASPNAVWRTIVDLYVSMDKAREQGRVTSVNDPGYPLGSYRMRMGKDGASDERVVHITERDDNARRLSLAADYLSVPGGLQVYATYQAQERPGGARFVIDCHTRANFEMPPSGPAGLPQAIAAAKDHSDSFLMDFLKRVKAQLERSK